MLHAWLDSWAGLGLIVVGMRRHGYDLALTSDENGWRATFLHRSHVMQPWVGQVLYWWATPWQAVQEAAWRALITPRRVTARTPTGIWNSTPMTARTRTEKR